MGDLVTNIHFQPQVRRVSEVYSLVLMATADIPYSMKQKDIPMHSTIGHRVLLTGLRVDAAYICDTDGVMQTMIPKRMETVTQRTLNPLKTGRIRYSILYK